MSLEFEGKLQVKENIISDWNGYGISATINIIPREMVLNRVYPNPFNPITSINYTLSNMDYVTLSIYNLAGQLIETLVNNQQESGSHTLTWDAALLPSGMYFLRMETSNKIFHQKLMLLK